MCLVCVSFRAVGRYGAILADEMGLGKTLQSVALSWTLLKQGPYGGKPVAKRVLVVTPGSLVQNWGAEFNKWLGRERISVFTVDQVRKRGNSIRSVTPGSIYHGGKARKLYLYSTFHFK